MAVATLTPAELYEPHRRWEHTALTTELLLALLYAGGLSALSHPLIHAP